MYSSLNPDAPEFLPNFAAITGRGYEMLSKTVRISNNFPTGQSANICNTSADFISLTFQLREKVVDDTNAIIKSEKSGPELKINENNYNAEKIVHMNDSFLDRINVNMDCIANTNETSNECENISLNNIQPITQVRAMPPPADANVPRPQSTFKDPVDNSHNIWVPKIADKPNSLKPLELKIYYNIKGKVVGYEHPYKKELNLYHPPSTALIPDRKPPRFPNSFENTPLTYVDTESQVDALVQHLNEVHEMAVDVEHHSLRTFQGITCLIQISTSSGDFIIDTLAVREHLSKLNMSFTDPRKIKVLHGAKMDVLWLQRDFGVYIVGLFDTYQAAKTLKMSNLSLKGLLKHYCNVNVDKRYQLSDWRIRPLPQEMINYARSDTHYLLYIWRMMKNQLLRADNGQIRLLLSVFDESRRVCAATYQKKICNEKSYLDLYVDSGKTFNTQQMVAFKVIYRWRDTQARNLDESYEYLLPNHMLLELAEKLPRGISGLMDCCRPVPPFISQNLIELNQLIESCLKLPIIRQLYPMPQGVKNMVDYKPNIKNVHDNSHSARNSRNQPMNSKRYDGYIKTEKMYNVNVHTFKYPNNGGRPKRIGAKSTLNADAKLFVPPYERFKKYRDLAQVTLIIMINFKAVQN